MADTLDVVTLAEAKTTLGVKASSTSLDTQLALYITAVSRRLDRACGAIVRRTVTAERHDGGRCRIRLEHPAHAITSVTEYRGTSSVALTAETLGTAPDDGYLAEPHKPGSTTYSGTIWRRGGGGDVAFWAGRLNIAVTYTGGRYENTAGVDARFKDAAFIMLRNLWATREPGTAPLGEVDTPGGRFPTFAVPNAARELLLDEWREIPGAA